MTTESQTNEHRIIDAVERVVRRWNASAGAHQRVVLPRAEALVDPHAPEGEDWYYVELHQEDESAPAFDFYYILHTLETELTEELGLNVLLVPVLPADLG